MESALIHGLKDIVAISAGADFALALDKNGDVFGWGAGQQCEPIRSGRVARCDARVLGLAYGGQFAGAVRADAGVREGPAGGGGGGRCEYARSAGLVADAAFCFLHDFESGALGADPDNGVGTGTSDPGQCHRAGPGPAESAADRRPFRTAIGVSAARAWDRSGRGRPSGGGDPEFAGDDGTDDRAGWRTAHAVGGAGLCRGARGMTAPV